MVIVLQIVLMLGIHKDRRYLRTPSYSTLIVTVQVLMTILLIASTTSLIMVGVDLFKADKAYRDKYGEGRPGDHLNNILLGSAFFCDSLTCLSFLEDIPQDTRMYRLQRAKEIAEADDSQ
ncbi:uncharacterized protein LOC113665652 [Pocillopora damicornis]|uniref:uncharacterized protein LOC113665652 n=1 Tax=Pocillopora damicornis TaxID=46731 RepID=UPI000F54F40B|nr:uncharacterized protein LOC113665652 [Pocillopora damicornis]